VTQYVLSNNNGDTKLKNGTTITAASGQTAFDVYYWPTNTYLSVSVEIETSDVVITGKVEYASDGSAGWVENAKLIIPAAYTLAAPAGFEWVPYYDTGKLILREVVGDINRDGETDVLDVIKLLNHVNNSQHLQVTARCDINGDENIDILDVVRLLNQVNGTESPHELPELP
jgi:hypothetical protein